MKDFLRRIYRDPSDIIPVIKAIEIEYSVKKFLIEFKERVPQSDRYIGLKVISELCNNKENDFFSKVFRISFANFLKNEFKLEILTKKKDKAEYLRAGR